jgi:MerR family copper efflux transcriptional regulator
MQAAAYAIRLEQAYNVGPSELAFALRALTEPTVYEDLRRLSEMSRRGGSSPIAALDFEQEKARRLLRAP